MAAHLCLVDLILETNCQILHNQWRKIQPRVATYLQAIVASRL